MGEEEGEEEGEEREGFAAELPSQKSGKGNEKEKEEAAAAASDDSFLIAIDWRERRDGF